MAIELTGLLRSALVCALVCAFLALPACAVDITDTSRYEVRNSPVPVPPPRIKPQKPKTAAATRSKPRQKPQTAKSGAITVTVARGDTVYALGRRYGATPRAIIESNNLRAPFTLRPGQRLRIPAAQMHVVRAGETSYGISRRYGVDLAVLTRSNGIRPPYTLAIGQELKIPGRAAVASVARSTPVARPSSTPPPRSGRGFAWPADGPVISRFGPKPGGLHNDGINIKVPRGASVKAADAGIVAYAGDELEGFGNLILLRHAGGWVTAYAHNDRILVRRGERVERGQVVARAGTTGNAIEPQLHFEIRKGVRAVDPLRYLSRRAG
ncbi:MAG: peptidoglycan DD-metalloendopeptidase family protein [Sphingomonadales bacterium]|nr:peptidoglycan DD-metalloendopeptidase family protein [Sphingomonadales bacterium]